MVFKKKVQRRRYTKKAKRIYRKSGVPGYLLTGLGILILRRAVPRVPYLNQLPGGLAVPMGMVIASKFGGKSIPRGVGTVGKALAVASIAESVIGGNIPMLSGSSTNGGAW
jgi:hypothetical protein